MSQDNQRLGVWHDMQSQHCFRENPTDPDAPTLRDKFAMAALTGIVAFQTDWGRHPMRLELHALAGDAYRVADAMLKERSAKPEEK